jgi:hypothetical protein
MAIEGNMPANKVSSTITKPHTSVRPQFLQLMQYTGKVKLLDKLTDDLSYPARLEDVRIHLSRIGK